MKAFGRIAPPVVTPGTGMFALTSVPPVVADAGALRACVRSWQAAGLQVFAFNHAAEAGAVRRLLGVEVVAVPDDATMVGPSGQRYVTINAMLDWARARDVTALLINADIELRLAPWELQRVRWRARGGLAYFVRHNHDGDPRWGRPEAHGIDAFVLDGRDAALFAPSRLSMGIPFWDYWLPHAFLTQGRPLLSVEFPAALHRDHPPQWRADVWQRCAQEFDRLTGALGPDRSPEAWGRASNVFRRKIAAQSKLLAPQPFEVAAWVREKFRPRGPKTFVTYAPRTAKRPDALAAVPDGALHAFEPAAEALDDRTARAGLTAIDLVWADGGGAAPELLAGGAKTLARTRYLYARYAAGDLPEGLRALQAMQEALPAFQIVELWPEHVLFENRARA